MEINYTDEINTQILIQLLKAHGIKKVIASPGATNINFVSSIQQDEWFEIYSVVDERSAAYVACGMAEESGEPVVLSCTGATASRNYMSALTEAFYRKLPILAVTSTKFLGRIGHNEPQVIDRTSQLNDIVNYSVQVPICNSSEEKWSCNTKINTALLELKRNGGGPVHINLETTLSRNHSVKVLPKERIIKRYGYGDELPEINKDKIGVFVGAHSKWSDEFTKIVDKFCEKYNAVVLCDQTSNYRGKYRVLANLILNQTKSKIKCNDFDLIINIGNVSGAYAQFNSKEVWRVNPDGIVRDTYRNLKNVFEMSEKYFFEFYTQKDINKNSSECIFINEWKNKYEELYNLIPELPFSNIWIAKTIAPQIPKNSIVHLAILNTLRSWNFFETPKWVDVYSNTGGFGIDGILSTAIGAALASPKKNVFCIIGDLAFFYDMNALGIRDLPNNLKILIINNGKGTEFRNYNHHAALLGESADRYVAAANHNGAKSSCLVKHYSEDLGLNYTKASNKEEFIEEVKKFLNVDNNNKKAMVFEVFTNSEDESKALELINTLEVDTSIIIKEKTKGAIKKIIGNTNLNSIKKIIKKK